jgi:hypothetical protein
MATAKSRTRRRFPMWLRLVALALLIAVAAGAWLRIGQADRIAVATAYGARIGCTCHYIGGRELDGCTADFEPGMEAVFLSGNAADKSVTGTIPLLGSTTAHYREGEGCVLESWRG